MQPQTDLTYQLKKLKLSGVLDTIEVRTLESQQNQLDYQTFLSLLLQDEPRWIASTHRINSVNFLFIQRGELEARQTRKIQRLIKEACFGTEQTLERFDFTLAPHLNRAHVRELATCNFVRRAEGVILVGPPGTGKTHLAKALGHQACRKNFSVRFYKFHQLFQELTEANLVGSLDNLLNKLLGADLLIIDDFAFKKIDQQNSEWLYTIVDARYGAGSIILTSNRAMSDWMTVFPDPVIAGAILDRLAHQAHQIQLKGESVRKKIAQQTQNKTLPKS